MFYWTDDSPVGMGEIAARGRPAAALRSYRAGLYEHDPLSVRRMRDRGRRAAILTDHADAAPAASARAFRAHLDSIGVRNVLDFLFWRDGAAFGGLSVFEGHGDPALFDMRRDLIPAARRLIEFSLSTHPRLLRGPEGRRGARYGLTDREAQVAELVCAGLTNRDIAGELGISLGTTKTHMTRIFDKTGLENRASLVALLSRDRGGA